MGAVAAGKCERKTISHMVEILNKGMLENGTPGKLPEKVLQFGTGVLLRGLPDYFIEQANRQGLFNGRIVVVKSTGQGTTDEFERQDGLYTLHIKGLQHGKAVQERMLVSAISRVLHAASQWEEIKKVAVSPEVSVVVSNTTEVGIVLDEKDDLGAVPPSSFPGKLTALLYHRFRHFNGDPEMGWVILPTELISDNGSQLKHIVLQLAQRHNLGDAFTAWLEEACDFCNTLVDRIVPGKLAPADAAAQEAQLGYRDELAIMAEPFRLWAVEADSERVRRRLSFAAADAGMVIAPDIRKFKELKLRLLNGTHTFSCALAILCGFTTVKEAMQDAVFARYVSQLMRREIVPAIVGGPISEGEALAFADSVIDRFSNPFLDHRWLSISMNFTSKMRMRNVALLQQYIDKRQQPPKRMALGFSAYLLFMKGTAAGGEEPYAIQDEHAGYFADAWNGGDHRQVVDTVLRNESLWGVDLSQWEAFAGLVKHGLGQLLEGNALELIKQQETSQTFSE